MCEGHVSKLDGWLVNEGSFLEKPLQPGSREREGASHKKRSEGLRMGKGDKCSSLHMQRREALSLCE